MPSATRRCERTAATVVAMVFALGCGANAHTIVHGGRTRSYLLHVPAGLTEPAPLVIALHGGGSEASHMVRLGFDALADRERFIVVYPESTNGHWNDGRGKGTGALHVDDVGFISVLIDELAARYPLDRERVFATGISNGGIMSYRLACELADKVAAIAPVVGAVAAELAPRCSPSREVSVLAITGTLDPAVPWPGGKVQAFGQDHGAVLGATESVEMFAQRARCTAEATITWEPDRDPRDGTVVRRVDYGGCAAGATVRGLDVDGAGHTWPGGEQYLPAQLIGRVSREFSATDRIWQFFAALGRRSHPTPEPGR